MVLRANSLASSLSEHRLRVYGAWATILAKPFLSMRSIRAFASAGSMGFALPPRGLRVKNWNVFAPMDTASLPMCR